MKPKSTRVTKTRTKSKTKTNTKTFKDQMMVFKTMLISKLKFNPKNPIVRTDITHNGFKLLKNNIQKNGLLTPIVIANNNMIIDGNRRVTALKELGVKKVVVIQHNSSSHNVFDDLFVACHSDTMKINCCQELERYLLGAQVRPSTLQSIRVLEAIGGKRVLRQIVNLNKSPVSFSIGISQLRGYTGRKDKKFLQQALKWMFTVGSAYRLKSAIAELIPPARLVNVIERKIPLVSRWHDSYKPKKHGVVEVTKSGIYVNADGTVAKGYMSI